MIDPLEEARAAIAAASGAIIGAEIAPAEIDCPAQGCSARCAAPLRLGRDAGDLAAALQKTPVLLENRPLVQTVEAEGGHLLFSFTDAFFDTALNRMLLELPRTPEPGPVLFEDAARARAAYTARRMWMLARKAAGEPRCPENPAVRQALLLTLAVPERLTHPRGLKLRMLAASDALLCMTRSVLPRERPALSIQSAHVAELAARVFSLALNTLYPN